MIAGIGGPGWSTVRAQRLYSCALVSQASSDLPLPSLAPPPGVAALAGSRGAGAGASFTCGVRYDSPASTTALVNHIAGQMESVGWKPAGRNDDAWVALGVFRGASTGGAALTAHVIVTALEGTPYKDVALHIARHDAPGDDQPGRRAAGRSGGAGASAGGSDAAAPPMLTRMLYAGPVAGPGESHEKLVATPPGFANEISGCA